MDDKSQVSLAVAIISLAGTILVALYKHASEREITTWRSQLEQAAKKDAIRYEGEVQQKIDMRR